MLMYMMWNRFPQPLVVLYFGWLILFGVFFVINLFIAVLSDSYCQIMEAENHKEHVEESDLKRVLEHILYDLEMTK